jgi:hypothetical protein
MHPSCKLGVYLPTNALVAPSAQVRDLLPFLTSSLSRDLAAEEIASVNNSLAKNGVSSVRVLKLLEHKLCWEETKQPPRKIIK